MGINFADYVLGNKQLNPLGITFTKQHRLYSKVDARTRL